MPNFFSLPYIFGSLVVLGVAQACYYYVYLESPYDYYYRYCNVGCAGMDQNDENFNQCCLPMTSGQTAPAVCATLSSSCAAAGTTCTWGSAVPTSDQPSSTADIPATYTPPAYTPQARSAAPSTETVWVTSTTTTPCAVPSQTSEAAAPTSSPTDEECTCEDEGTTSEAAIPTHSSPGEGAINDGSVPFNSDTRRKRRGLRARGGDCICPTSSSSDAVPTTTAPPPPPQPTTSEAAAPTSSASEEECHCPPEDVTSEAAAPTQSSPGEGAINDGSIQINSDTRRRGLRVRGGECVCPSSTAAPPPPAPTPTDCVCPPEGSSSEAAVPTQSTPGEGALNDGSVPLNYDNRRRGLIGRGGECVCPTTGNAAAPTTSAPAPPPAESTPCTCAPSGTPPGEGSLPPAVKRGFMIRDTCVCPTTSEAAAPTSSAPGEGATPGSNWDTSDTRKRNTPPADFVGDYKRSEEPGENYKRNIPPTTVTSTTFITTDDCAQPTPTSESSTPAPPPETTSEAAAPTSSEAAPTTSESILETTSEAAIPTSSTEVVPPPAETPCDCPPEGQTPGEGSLPPSKKRGMMVRDTCVCPTTSEAAASTSSAPGEGAAAPSGFAGDNAKRRYRRWSDF
ncbi:uncharacterized protein L201_006946 [Kwoniella dendrophila CBS 6074]|uniref:Uncharacterized protein n=1 Tax=Kwoniella dendrophila CBS 6074 TaxID=1295534 RepID=A0AAX4K561_9TREE